MPQDGYNLLKNSKDKPKKFEPTPWFDFQNALNGFKKDHTLTGYPRWSFKCLIDIFGWILTFNGFNEPIKDKDKSCMEIYFKNKDNLKLDDENLRYNISLLYAFFEFNIELFYLIYQHQNNIEHLLNLIIKPEHFTNNRFSKNNLKNKPTEAKLYPNQDLPLNLPFIDNICDGINFPVQVTKNGDLAIKKLDIDAFGDGHFLLCNDEVMDCLRINDFWLMGEPLSLRKRFLYRAKGEEIPSLVCWNFQEMEDAAKILKTTPQNGLIIRELGEDYYSGRWFEWSSRSIYATHNNGFYSLNGDFLGDRGISQTEIKKFAFFDEIDLMNFKRILKV